MKFAVIIVFLLSGINILPDNTPPCDDFKITSAVIHTSGNQSNGEAEITAEGGQAPYKYIFFNEKGNPLSLDYDSKIIKNRPAGTFYCSVLDKHGCQRKVKIEIK